MYEPNGKVVAQNKWVSLLLLQNWYGLTIDIEVILFFFLPREMPIWYSDLRFHGKWMGWILQDSRDLLFPKEEFCHDHSD